MRTRKTSEQRFFEKVDKRPSGCWIWTGGRTRDGYGHFWTGEYHDNPTGNKYCPTMDLAHRWSYAHFVEPIKDGYYVLHHCDNPPCVNPEHLHQGTQRGNMVDCIGRNRHNLGRQILSQDQADYIRLTFKGEYSEATRLARAYGVGVNIISAITKGLPRHYGKHLL